MIHRHPDRRDLLRAAATTAGLADGHDAVCGFVNDDLFADWALDLAGDWTTVVAGPPVVDGAKGYAAAAYELGSNEGIVWQNLADKGDSQRSSHRSISSFSLPMPG